VDSRKSLFVPNTPDPLCVKGTTHLNRLPEMTVFKDPLTLDISYPSSLGFSFVLEIERC